MEMFLNLFRRHPEMDQSIQEMEDILERSMVQVEPSVVFINDLRKQLFNRQIPINEPSIWENVKNRLLLVGGVLGGIVVIISSIRAIISIFQIISGSIRGIGRVRSKPEAAPST
ncbi:MAG: hypothetical protein GWO08_16475 [Gammaproteobacteria bacterium]|nr:hypothetical protein [Phycisphaerae bacterium]NIR95191.1 hypothetical protein [Gammaproteobacteria bacterium]NIX30605.1 hypothetical protein [Phycisphaerae bacterium]